MKRILGSQADRHVAQVLLYGAELHLDSVINDLVSKLCEEAIHGNVLLFDALLLPALDNIESIWRDKNCPDSSPPWQQLFQGILSAYVVRYVQAEPKQAADWALTSVHCSCGDCTSLNAFLRHPAQKVGRFSM